MPPDFINENFQSSFKFNEIHPSDKNFQCFPENLKLQLFAKTELDNSVKDLGLTKDEGKLFVYKQLTTFFTQHKDLVYCPYIGSPINEFGVE